MRLSPNFTLEELTRSASHPEIRNVPDMAQLRNLVLLCVRILQPLRDAIGRPVRITSGFRCPKLNKAVGGATTSRHLTGQAAEEGFISADHILIMTVDPATGQPLDDETVAQKRATAEDLLAQLRASDDPVTLFSALADEYSEDTGRAANPDGYTFNENSGFVTEFTDAAYALAEGEISDIVESMYGYHILLRKPLDRTDAVQIAQPDYFDHYFMGAVDEAKVVTSDALEKIDVSALYAALTAAQSAQQTD